MEQIINNNPTLRLFSLIVVGVIVFLSIKFIQRYVLVLVKDNFYKKLIRKWEFRIISLIWLGYSSWALFHLLRTNYVVTGVNLTIVLIGGWRSWMEFFAGLTFRLERKIQINDVIKTRDYAGRIYRFNFQSLSIMTDDGQLVHVPYSLMTNSIVAQSTDQERLMAQSFLVELSAEKPHEMRQYIEKLVVSCPWTAISHQAQVVFDGNQGFKVTAKAIDNHVFFKIERYVKRHLKALRESEKQG